MTDFKYAVGQLLEMPNCYTTRQGTAPLVRVMKQRGTTHHRNPGTREHFVCPLYRVYFVDTAGFTRAGDYCDAAEVQLQPTDRKPPQHEPPRPWWG